MRLGQMPRCCGGYDSLDGERKDGKGDASLASTPVFSEAADEIHRWPINPKRDITGHAHEHLGRQFHSLDDLAALIKRAVRSGRLPPAWGSGGREFESRRPDRFK
jgi:hypothetical protein